MNEYELLYVISPRLSAEDVDAMVERVGGLIEGVGGSVSMVDNWGRRRLAYPIRHHFEGTYVLSYVNLPGERAAEFERALNINEDILRHLLISGVIPGYEGPPEQEVDMRRPAGGRSSFADRPAEAAADAPPADAPPADAPAEGGEAAPAETPAAAPAAEAPVAEAAAAEAPAAEAPAAETEAPAEPAEAPAAEAPSAETEAPAAEATAPETEAAADDAASEETEAPPAAVAGAE